MADDLPGMWDESDLSGGEADSAPELEPHQCHFCGTWVKDGYSVEKDKKRHWLSDCRPDLVEHEPGPDCTWPYRSNPSETCYAYQDVRTTSWTSEHIHFYPDGPM